MKQKLFTILATLALGSGIAYAQDQGGKPADAAKAGATGMKSDADKAMKSQMVNRHLALVDLYLNQAIDSCKVLSGVADQQLAKTDSSMLTEAKTNIDSDIGRALTHVQELKAKKTAAATPEKLEKQDMVGRLGEVEQALKDARTAAKKIDISKAGGAQAIDDAGSHLMAAQNALREVAKQTNYTMLSDVKLGTVPVRGTEPGEMNKDTNKSDDLNKDINNQDLNKDINKDVNKDLHKSDTHDTSKDPNHQGGTTY